MPYSTQYLLLSKKKIWMDFGAQKFVVIRSSSTYLLRMSLDHGEDTHQPRTQGSASLDSLRLRRRFISLMFTYGCALHRRKRGETTLHPYTVSFACGCSADCDDRDNDRKQERQFHGGRDAVIAFVGQKEMERQNVCKDPIIKSSIQPRQSLSAVPEFLSWDVIPPLLKLATNPSWKN